LALSQCAEPAISRHLIVDRRDAAGRTAAAASTIFSEGDMVKTITRYVLESDVLKGSAAAFALKFAASVLGFTMFALASRSMDPASFGSLAIIFNAMSFLSVLALCGQETLIVRSWNEYCGTDRPALARGVLTFGARVAFAVALFLALAVAVAWSFWDRTVSHALVFAACAFLFMHSQMQFTGQFSRVAAGVVIGETPREFLWRLLVVLSLLAYHALDIDFGAAGFLGTLAVAIFIAITLQLFWVAPSIPIEVKRAQPAYDVPAWIPRSFKMWISALLDTTGQYLEVVIVGLILGPAAAGVYFVATRITNVFAMITGGVAVYATSQISALFYSSGKAELQSMLRALSIIGAILNGTALLVIIVAGKLLLWAFGGIYVSAYPALIVLAIGASIGALVGPAAHVLLLTGHEGTYPRIMAAVLLVRFALIAALGPSFGLMGAVVAWTISAVILTLALVIACRRLVGLDPSLGFTLWGGQTQTVRLKEGAP
jgi:O-antigen/teichoic acid export membrane protein